MKQQHAVAAKATHINGLDVQAAVDTIAAIKADKTLAKFQFRAKNVWISGGENRSTIRDFYGAGREDNSRGQAFEFINGEPPVLLGDNEGANPVEFLLHALAGCVTTTFVLHAMARGIAIRELSTVLEGDIDLQGLLGLDDAVSPGYEQIRIRCTSRRTVRMRTSTTCWPTRSSTHPCAIPCVGRSRLRSNELPRNQTYSSPPCTRTCGELSFRMSVNGTKRTNSISSAMSTNDPKQIFSAPYSRLEATSFSEVSAPVPCGGCPRVRRNFPGRRLPRGALLVIKTHRTSGCPIRHTMPRPL